VKIRWGLIMAERILGQLSLADGLVAGIAQSVLDDIATVVDWPALAAVLGSRNGAGPGSPGYPSLLLLRCLLLGVWHGLSDPALEHAIKDRLSFRRFAGLSLHDPVPDHSTLWRFRMELAADGLVDRVLAEINRQLEVKGLIVKHGTLVDASLVAARARPGSKPGARGRSLARLRLIPTRAGAARASRASSATRFTSEWMPSTPWCAASP